MCVLRIRPRTGVDPPRFLDRTAISGGHIVLPPPGGGQYLVTVCFKGNPLIEALILVKPRDYDEVPKMSEKMFRVK